MSKRVKELEKGINNKEVFRKIQIVANWLQDIFVYDYIDKNATIDSFIFYLHGLYQFDIIKPTEYNILLNEFEQDINKLKELREKEIE